MDDALARLEEDGKTDIARITNVYDLEARFRSNRDPYGGGYR